jgi:hypothetical protein
LVDKPIVGCSQDDVPEIQSHGGTLSAWRAEIVADHTTGASNGAVQTQLIDSQTVRHWNSRDSVSSWRHANPRPLARGGVHPAPVRRSGTPR